MEREAINKRDEKYTDFFYLFFLSGGEPINRAGKKQRRFFFFLLGENGNPKKMSFECGFLKMS